MGELTLLGKITINAAPVNNSEIFKIEVTAENRDEVIHGETKEGETIDQFILRLKGILKAMFNAPLKKELQMKEKERQKQEITGGGFVMGGKK